MLEWWKGPPSSSKPSPLPTFHHSIVPSFPPFPAQKLDYLVPMGNELKAKIALTLNGEAAEVAFAPHKTLLEVLREDLGLTGTKHGCELGECGTCTVLLDGTPVLLLAADALLQSNPKPTRDEIKDALAGNLCRCTGYIKIYEAVELAAARMRGEKAEPKTESLYGR